MIFGNEVMFELNVYDENLIIGIDLIFESDKENEEFENEDDIDIFQMELGQEESLFRLC